MVQIAFLLCDGCGGGKEVGIFQMTDGISDHNDIVGEISRNEE